MYYAALCCGSSCMTSVLVLCSCRRCFGGSEGSPRNWVSPRRHLEDWDAAVQYVLVSRGMGMRGENRGDEVWQWCGAHASEWGREGG